MHVKPKQKNALLPQGPRIKFYSGGGGLKKNAGGNLGDGGHVWEFLFNFFQATENAFITIKLLIFFHTFSDVAIGSQNPPSLNLNIIDCCTTDISTFDHYKQARNPMIVLELP